MSEDELIGIEDVIPEDPMHLFGSSLKKKKKKSKSRFIKTGY